MYSKIRLLTVLCWLPIFVFSQDCNLILSGKVNDSGNGQPLDYVNVYLEDHGTGAVSDSSGFFRINDLCPGHYHVLISHIGCESKRLFIDIEEDTELKIEMDHSTHELGSVQISASATSATTQSNEALNEQSIRDNAHKNLSNMLESVTGVSTLKNGNISKPVVHGLYGNRITILNNGIAQSGQQWGNDHAPEIDPLVANKIRVIKGVGSLEYQGANLGGVILVEPKRIDKEPHLHGKGNYFFETNGLSNGVNIQVQQYHPTVAWKVNGTFKKSGDKRAAKYFLKNTGGQEADFALQLEKAFSEQFSTDLYVSSFNTELGVLKGSHIGNLTDLESALTRDEPFFTEKKFSYEIEAPRQAVHHQLLKLHSKYILNDRQIFDFTVAGQLNVRKEYDIRRGERSDIPAMNLRQFSTFLEGKYRHEFDDNLHLKSGVQFNFIDNTNDPDTGVSPLIPDYFTYESAAFAILTKKLNSWFFELGGRYDNALQNAAFFSQTVPRELLQYSDFFHNISATGGFTYRPNHDFSIAYNLGYTTRNPAVNELYSSGLHQGVSGIEEGDANLSPERSLKTTLSLIGTIKEKLSFESLFYLQQIDDYIYLNPQDEIRLTIRGAFPVFRYEQTKAQIYGLDLRADYEITQPLSLELTYSYLRGRDLTSDVPLINMPSNNLTGSLKYVVQQWNKFENIEFELTDKYVFEQQNFLSEQDFVAPPKGYNLLGFQIATDIQLKTTRLRAFTKVDNLLNVSYRDYLNRQRYFADDMGINITAGVSVPF